MGLPLILLFSGYLIQLIAVCIPLGIMGIVVGFWGASYGASDEGGPSDSMAGFALMFAGVVFLVVGFKILSVFV